MKTIKHFLAILLCISLCAPLTQAQPSPDKRQDAQTTNTIAQDVLIIIQQEQVRFTSQKAVAEMQLQIFDQAGQMVYDSGAVTGPELTWVLRQANGEAVKSGLYAYALSVREAGAETARVRRGHFIVDRAKERDGQTDRLWITSQNDSGVGTELTVARNEGVTIAGTNLPGEGRSAQAAEGAVRDDETQSKSEIQAAMTAQATGTAGRIAKFTSSTNLGNSEIFEQNKKIGIGSTSPISKLHIVSGASDLLPPRLQSTAADTFAAGWDFYHGATGKGYVGVPGPAAGIAPGDLLLFGGSGTRTSIWGGGRHGLTVNTSGDIGIGTENPAAKLHISSNASAPSRMQSPGGASFAAGWDFYHGTTGKGYVGVPGPAVGLAPGELLLFGASGTPTSIWGGGVRGVTVAADGNVGIGTPNPEAKLDVAGTTRTSVLQITGGADFAENFEINFEKTNNDAATAKVEAGLVVSIDPASPGKLALSARGYDRRVAGVISGAGGVNPGMVMSQEGTLADGQHPVALSGRVYCWVDASQGAIEPGDLLTTSGTPGHAMKAADAAQAQGAIIGKAMTGLKSGKGLVLVLVTLQ